VTFLTAEYSPTLSFFLPPNFQIFSRHTVLQHLRLYSCFSVSDKFGTHNIEEQNYSHLFHICFYVRVYAKKTKCSGLYGCKYSSNLTAYLSITPKFVHFSHFLRIYMFLCFVTFSWALFMRLHRHKFPRLILDHFSFYIQMLFINLFSTNVFTKWSNKFSVGQKLTYKF
jgi:hypothetical protein